MEPGYFERNSERYLFYFYLMLAAAAGLVMINLGVLALADSRSFYHFFIGRAVVPPMVALISVGTLYTAAAVTIFCCYSYSDRCSWRALIILSVFVFLSLSLFDVIYAFHIQHSNFNHTLSRRFFKSIHEYPTDGDTRRAWNLLQGRLKCCGVGGPHDWKTVLPSNASLPSTCYVVERSPGSDAWEKIQVQAGCRDKLYYAFLNSLYLVGLEAGLKL